MSFKYLAELFTFCTSYIIFYQEQQVIIYKAFFRRYLDYGDIL